MVTNEGQEFVRNRRFLFPTQKIREPWIRFPLASSTDSDHGPSLVAVPGLQENSSLTTAPAQEP